MEKYCLCSPNNKNIFLFIFRTLQRQRLGTCTCPWKPQTLTPDSGLGGRGRLWQRSSDGPVLQSDVCGAFGALLQTTHSQTHRSMGETNAQRQVQRSSRGGYATTEGCERGERKLLLFLDWEKRFMYIPLIAVHVLKKSSVVSSPGDKPPHADNKSNLFWATLHRVLVLDYVKSSPLVQLLKYCQLDGVD